MSLKSLKIRQIVTYDWESIIGADTDERGVFLNCLFFVICSVVKYIFSVEEYSLAYEKVFSSFIEISQKSTSEFIYLRLVRWQFWLNKLTKWSQMLCSGNKKKVVHLNCFRTALILNLEWLSHDKLRETKYSSLVSLGWCHLIKDNDGNDDDVT